MVPIENVDPTFLFDFYTHHRQYMLHRLVRIGLQADNFLIAIGKPVLPSDVAPKNINLNDRSFRYYESVLLLNVLIVKKKTLSKVYCCGRI